MPIPYQLIRSAKRKTLAIHIKQAQVIVRAPSLLPNHEIERFVALKAPWIQQKVQLQQKVKQAESELLPYINYFGQRIALKYTESNRFSVQQTEHAWIISGTQNMGWQQAFKQYLIAQATPFLIERLAFWQQKTQLHATAVEVKRFKARWGSCDQFGKIKLNDLLCCLPVWVLDYVLVHELCHLKHLNHSPQFWLLVNHHYPQTPAAKRYLKQHAIGICFNL